MRVPGLLHLLGRRQEVLPTVNYKYCIIVFVVRMYFYACTSTCFVLFSFSQQLFSFPRSSLSLCPSLPLLA